MEASNQAEMEQEKEEESRTFAGFSRASDEFARGGTYHGTRVLVFALCCENFGLLRSADCLVVVCFACVCDCLACASRGSSLAWCLRPNLSRPAASAFVRSALLQRSTCVNVLVVAVACSVLFVVFVDFLLWWCVHFIPATQPTTIHSKTPSKQPTPSKQANHGALPLWHRPLPLLQLGVSKQ